jgi:sialic acid synthase SpsE
MKANDTRVYIIAEIGTGHGGNIERARELVDAAAESGADCAKFQIVYADEILHPDTGFVTLPGGPVRLYDRFLELEVAPAFYAEISAYCASRDIDFLCTPFGLKSARELKALRPKRVKIASPELNHLPLLRETASWDIPMILSTGVSTLADIERALAATESAPHRTLLHCVTSYPAPEEDYNLSVLESLARVFGVGVGVSDHSLDPVLVPVLAVACGGRMVEKHITISKTDGGLDDPVALTGALFAEMVTAIRRAESMIKDEIIADLSARYGSERVRAILGSGVKSLATSERANYTRTNRSIHAIRSLCKGEVITDGDVALLRTEKVLSPGLAPEFLEHVIGARLARDVKNGEGISWDDVIIRR